QFRFSIADCFMAANNSVDSGLTLGLKCCDTRARIRKLTSESIGFDLSFGVLAGGSIALARETLRLLRQTLERDFEMTRNLSESLGNGGLGKKFGAGAFDLDLRRVSSGEFLRVRLFSSAKQQRASIEFLSQSCVLVLQAMALRLD